MRVSVVFFLLVASCLPLVAPPPQPAASARSGTVASSPAARTKPAPKLPTEFKPWDFVPGSKVDIKVDLSKELAPVTPYHFGNNVAWYDSKDWFKRSTQRAAASGIRFWRWPGGSSSDNYHWDGNYGSHTKDHEGGDPTNMSKSWAVSNDDFIEFCRATGSEAIVTVNYAAARYWNVEKAADLAARWVRYFNVEKKFKVRYWEIGNEVHGPWEEGNKMPDKPQLTGAIYGKDFKVFAQAMRKVDPDILIGAVAVDADNGDDWSGYRWWMRDMLPLVADSADFLIEHNYFMWPFEGDKFINPSNDRLFENVAKIAKAKSDIDAMVAKYAHRAKPLPVMMTEFNIINASEPHTIQLINGLFIAEALGETIKASYIGSNIWDWKNGLDGKLSGDHGMLATTDPSVPDSTPRPSYYAYALYDRAFGERMVEATSSEAWVKVYASRFAAGETGLIVVNQGNEPITVTIDLGARKGQGTAVGWVLDGREMNAKQVRWNGVPGPEGGGGPFPFDTIPPYLRKYDPSSPVALSLPANSASGVVLY
jgi:hypothetical protein